MYKISYEDLIKIAIIAQGMFLINRESGGKLTGKEIAEEAVNIWIEEQQTESVN